MFGMHPLWWLFWFSVIVLFFSLVTPVPCNRMRETPPGILQRRYGAVDMCIEEYEERKKHLERHGRKA